MSSPFTYAWQNVQRGCFEYWNRAFGTIEGVTAFSMRNVPKTLPDEDTYFIWRFTISGGAIAVPRASRAVALNGAWLMDAQMEAWARSEDTAMLVGGLVMENEPVLGTDVEGLLRLYATSFPAMEPDTIRLGGDNNAGQEILCVRLTVPMQCDFGNTDRRT